MASEQLMRPKAQVEEEEEHPHHQPAMTRKTKGEMEVEKDALKMQGLPMESSPHLRFRDHMDQDLYMLESHGTATRGRRCPQPRQQQRSAGTDPATLAGSTLF